MNKPLRRVALAMMAMVLLLMANVTYVQVIEADDLRHGPVSYTHLTLPTNREV